VSSGFASSSTNLFTSHESLGSGDSSLIWVSDRQVIYRDWREGVAVEGGSEGGTGTVRTITRVVCSADLGSYRRARSVVIVPRLVLV
jgi:hypothetical protein